MADAFRTKTNATDRVEIAGVGLLEPEGKGFIRLDHAAQTMPELQERDENGDVKLDDDGNPTALEGKELKDAAREFADTHDLRVVKVDDNLGPADSAVEVGAAAAPEDAREKSIREYEETYAGLEHVNESPEEMTEATGDAGQPAPPPEGHDDEVGR